MDRDIAVGTTDGKLVAVSFEEKEKKERGGKVFLGMSEEGEAIHGIAQLPLQQGQLLLLLATAKRLQAFVGPTSLEKLGEGYHTRSGMFAFFTALDRDRPAWKKSMLYC